jgi:AcrR family transcriptional regulator
MPPKTRAARVSASKRPRRRLAADQRRQQIIDGAVAYFAEVGFEGGTRALAKKLGVTQPLIYRYFPSKEDLIRQVYNDVYVGRWRTEWEELISDRRLPLRERLTGFYERYTDVIFTTEWIRIYLFSGLRGLGINQWWISFVEDHILRKICEEIRFAYGLPDPGEMPIQDAELDLYWMFHGGIFYYGMRQYVYRANPHLPLPKFIELSVDSLLDGLPASVGHVLDKARRPNLTE